MSGYLASYREGSSRYGHRGEKAFKPTPKPYKPETRAPGANDNAPRPSNDNVRVAKTLLRYTKAGRLVLRRVPWINVAWTIYDLSQLLRPNDYLGVAPTGVLAGWVTQVQGACPKGIPPTHYTRASGNSPWSSGNCFANGVVISHQSLLDPLPAATGQIRWEAYLGGYANTSANRFQSVNLQYNPVGDLPAKTLLYRRVVNLPRPMPVLDPDLLPIQQPVNLPIPRPVNPRNDPVQMNRNNGERSPRLTPRRPPVGPTKERKVRPFGALGQLLIRAIHATTEGLDALDAIHDALPKEYQAKASFHDGRWWKATATAKAEAIAKNFDKLDLNDAMLNLLVNHFTDKLIGGAYGRFDDIMSPVFGGYGRHRTIFTGH